MYCTCWRVRQNTSRLLHAGYCVSVLFVLCFVKNYYLEFVIRYFKFGLVKSSEKTSFPQTMSKIGKVESKKRKRMFEDTYVEWKIADFFSVTEYALSSTCFESPTFSVAGVPFLMELYPRNYQHRDDACLYLKSRMSRKFTVEYSFGLKEYDGTVELLSKGTMKPCETTSINPAELKIKSLEGRKWVVVSDNAVTITCTLNAKTPLSAKENEFDYTKGLKLRKLDKLSQNFKDLFGNKDTCDTTLKVKDKVYKAHRLVLIARCSVFAATFKHDTLEKQTGVITIPDCDPVSFEKFLEYLYCGEVEGLSYESALHLCHTSDKYGVQELKAFCVDFLKQCLTIENMFEIIILADKYSESALFSAVQDFFNKNVSNILVTSEWESLMKTHYHLANQLLIKMPKVACEGDVSKEIL